MALISSLLEWLNIKSVLLIVTVFLVVSSWMQRRRRLPPGPWRFPLIGYFPQLMWAMYKGEDIHKIATRLGEKYGKIYSFDLFGMVFVVINDFVMLREGSNDPAFGNKGFNNRLQSAILGSHAYSYKHNAPLRKFLLTAFRGLGIGKRSFEADIVEESEALLGELGVLEGKPCNPRSLLNNTTANVLFKFLLGMRHDYNDKDFQHLLGLNHKSMDLMGGGGWSLLIPFYFPTKDSKALIEVTGEIIAFLSNVMDKHRENFDPENPNDFIDLCLKELKDNPTPEDPQSYLHKYNMERALYLLFLAGGDTVGTTLEWCCVYLMAYPDIQEKIQKELDSVVGRDRLPQLADRSKLPYTRAALWEVQRIALITPLSDFHATNRDTTLAGYCIPKGATIVYNCYAVSRDPNVFPEPDQFKPERFIDEHGEYNESDRVLPFGIGRRVCPGENIAKMELFVFFTHLLHRFSIVKPAEAPPINFEGFSGGTFSPNPFTAKFVLRD